MRCSSAAAANPGRWIKHQLGPRLIARPRPCRLMATVMHLPLLSSFLLLAAIARADDPITTATGLIAAIRDGAEGASLAIGEGTFELEGPLEPKAGMTIKGAGVGKTIITHAAAWKPSTETLPDPEMRTEGMDTRAYLFRLGDDADGITISDMTLRGPQLHGAIFGWNNAGLHLHNLRIENFLWTGIRTFSMSGARIHDCDFIDAGGRWERGQPGEKGGITGGAIFPIWMKDSEIWNNRFTRTKTEPEAEFYGIKGRQGKRSRIHHNTIEVNFSIEFPFENDEDMEIDHNILHGTVSLPKHAGGPVPESGSTFRVHHNYFKDSYAIEFPRNGIEIHHNLFDFDPAKDHGNLISSFGQEAIAGPASFHNNLVNNPGRGVIWINQPTGSIEVRNNHIIARTTATPRTEGLFGFNSESDFKNIHIHHNIIECIGTARPLVRNEESAAARIENNVLTNIIDASLNQTQQAGTAAGPEAPLEFACGVDGEMTVSGWEIQATPRP